MSRSNYSDDIDQWQLIKWRGQVASAVRGKRGQRLLIDLVAALDALPEKVLIAGELVSTDGAYCALGAVGKLRGVNMTSLDPYDSESVADTFDIADQLAREIAYENDEAGPWRGETPEQRWSRVRAWAISQIQPVPVSGREDE